MTYTSLPAQSCADGLREAAELRALVSSAAAAIVSIDAAGSIQMANPAVEKLFGYTSAELIGRNVGVLIGGGEANRHDTHIHRYITTGRSGIMGVGREVFGRRKDGSEFPLHLSIGEFEVDGARHFTGVMIDLSRQKSAERDLERQKALFRAVFECLPDPVIISDLDRRVRDVNPAFVRVFGLQPQAIIGSTTRALYARPDDWELVGGFASHPCLANNPEEIVTPHVLDLKRVSGEVFPGAVVKTLIETATGQCLGFLELIRDVSRERERAAQLMQAQRMEAIGQLTGGIAHDFNNILTVVLGNVELIEMTLAGDDGNAALAREAREAAEIGARLTDRLLTFGRRQMLETRQINLNEFVLGLTELLRRTIGEDIDLSTALDSHLALTEADPGQVENAVINLAINARDAMPKGGIIMIETRNVTIDETDAAAMPELAPGRYVVLSVSDSGHGMPQDVKARAFEPFFTTKGSGTGRGTGLGLATIYGFVKQSGGHATIDSEVGRGTTVELFLPAVETPEAFIERRPTAQPAPLGEGRRVLVVEDNERVRRMACRQLEALGYEVREAASAIDALEAMAGGLTCDVVFSDVVMPGGLSGLDLAREIATHFPGVAVVLTTGYSDDMLDQPGEADARPVFIRKPYTRAKLAAALATAAGRAGMPDTDSD